MGTRSDFVPFRASGTRRPEGSSQRTDYVSHTPQADRRRDKHNRSDFVEFRETERDRRNDDALSDELYNRPRERGSTRKNSTQKKKGRPRLSEGVIKYRPDSADDSIDDIRRLQRFEARMQADRRADLALAEYHQNPQVAVDRAKLSRQPTREEEAAQQRALRRDGRREEQLRELQNLETREAVLRGQLEHAELARRQQPVYTGPTEGELAQMREHLIVYNLMRTELDRLRDCANEELLAIEYAVRTKAIENDELRRTLQDDMLMARDSRTLEQELHAAREPMRAMRGQLDEIEAENRRLDDLIEQQMREAQALEAANENAHKQGEDMRAQIFDCQEQLETRRQALTLPLRDMPPEIGECVQMENELKDVNALRVEQGRHLLKLRDKLWWNKRVFAELHDEITSLKEDISVRAPQQRLHILDEGLPTINRLRQVRDMDIDKEKMLNLLTGKSELADEMIDGCVRESYEYLKVHGDAPPEDVAMSPKPLLASPSPIRHPAPLPTDIRGLMEAAGMDGVAPLPPRVPYMPTFGAMPPTVLPTASFLLQPGGMMVPPPNYGIPFNQPINRSFIEQPGTVRSLSPVTKNGMPVYVAREVGQPPGIPQQAAPSLVYQPEGDGPLLPMANDQYAWFRYPNGQVRYEPRDKNVPGEMPEVAAPERLSRGAPVITVSDPYEAQQRAYQDEQRARWTAGNDPVDSRGSPFRTIGQQQQPSLGPGMPDLLTDEKLEQMRALVSHRGRQPVEPQFVEQTLSELHTLSRELKSHMSSLAHATQPHNNLSASTRGSSLAYPGALDQ